MIIVTMMDVMKQIWREICYCENKGMNMLSLSYMCLLFRKNEEIEIKKKRVSWLSYVFFSRQENIIINIICL